jgi:tripartite-type tricarboxylate transporter receptor subunit TctC
LVDGGRIKLIAATSLKRAESLKDIPTIAEQGVPGFEALAWNGLFAPAGTPQALIDRINADVNAALADPGVRAAFVKQGLIVGGGSAAEFKAFIDQDSKKWGAIIDKVGIKID